MMEPAFSYFSGYCIHFLLFQVMPSTSENLMVTVPKGHFVARVGGQAALSCQLSPPQSAEHMEVRWFRGDNSQLVYLYRGGHEVNGEAAPEYVNRTEFVKDAMGEGKMTLKIHNVSISDDGAYWCSFKDTDFSDAASMNLSVAALGLETQIRVQVPTSDGLVVECNSGGWFPQPQMEWRNSRGEVVPHSSKSYSQDGARLFHMKMTLLLRNLSDCNITCCVHNPVIGEEKQASIILAHDLFDKEHLTKMFLILFTSAADADAADAAAVAVATDAKATEAAAAEAAEASASNGAATESPEISSLGTASITSDVNSDSTAEVAATELEVSYVNLPQPEPLSPL
ncbi:selection and upkeep of intraepithelial T-cells protein 8-like [Ictidomys tridecemlineatus]|uniref:selection and upkeep of intraepithelial T-cells protein 8-like n=1 Tax=Ictidomys tridecemlineatus TaxID=43179 RepID=UPI00038BF799|nr:selection and upkeep of intraepithelial T-cells protein 8-like [Ictidomys tridecemlineatus]KAG3283109.1 selection and upkeep of intraepithelial T-cells protein 8-like [Ictidomys tridecemlineatus]